MTHPNVCRVFDYALQEESAFFTMECVEGESLRERLTREGAYAPEAAGLAAAHDLGIVHRDFKSANILMERATGRAVITDFGLARNVRSEQAEPQIGLGTPTYMAPEQMEERPAGPRADLYSFGVVLYELVTGVVPWTGATPVALALKKIREAPPKPSTLAAGLPGRWDEVVLRCLACRPEDRYAGAMEIVAVFGTGAARRALHGGGSGGAGAGRSGVLGMAVVGGEAEHLGRGGGGDASRGVAPGRGVVAAGDDDGSAGAAGGDAAGVGPGGGGQRHCA